MLDFFLFYTCLLYTSKWAAAKDEIQKIIPPTSSLYVSTLNDWVEAYNEKLLNLSLIHIYDISEKSYYYWLRKIRRDVCEQEGLQAVTNPSALSFVEIPVKTALDTAPVPTVPTAMTPVAVIG